MINYNIMWYWPEEMETLEHENPYIIKRDVLRVYLETRARDFFDKNPGIETLKAAVIDFEINESFIMEFEKKPIGEYEIVTTSY